MYIGLYVQYRLLPSGFNETWILLTEFRKKSNAKFHENPSCGSRVVPWRRMDGRTDRFDEANSRFLRTRLKISKYVTNNFSRTLLDPILESDFTWIYCYWNSTSSGVRHTVVGESNDLWNMTLGSHITPYVHTKMSVKIGRLVEKFERADTHTETHRHVAQHSRTILRNLNKSKLKATRNLNCLIPFLVLQPSFGPCFCQNPYSDKRYGPQRCTVTEKSLPSQTNIKNRTKNTEEVSWIISVFTLLGTATQREQT